LLFAARTGGKEARSQSLKDVGKKFARSKQEGTGIPGRDLGGGKTKLHGKRRKRAELKRGRRGFSTRPEEGLKTG